jgi:hypothetical protein
MKHTFGSDFLISISDGRYEAVAGTFIIWQTRVTSLGGLSLLLAPHSQLACE